MHKGGRGRVWNTPWDQFNPLNRGRRWSRFVMNFCSISYALHCFFSTSSVFFAKNILIFKNLEKYEPKIYNTIPHYGAIFFVIFGIYPLSDKCRLSLITKIFSLWKLKFLGNGFLHRFRYLNLIKKKFSYIIYVEIHYLKILVTLRKIFR